MLRRIQLALFLTVLAVLAPAHSFACSLAVLKSADGMLVARTMDWPTAEGYVVKNYPGTARSARLIMFSPHGWTSKYGSITLNVSHDVFLIGKRDVPGCGLNEKGLYAAELWVTPPPQVKYPAVEPELWMTSAEVVQYLLDTCACVDEAIAEFKRLSLEGFSFLSAFKLSLNLHYFIADSSGKTAVLEYPNAELKIYREPAYPVMTNHFRDISHAELRKYRGFGGTQPIPEAVPFARRTSLTRFVLCCDSLVRSRKMNRVNVNTSFELLERAAAFNSPIVGDKRGRVTTQWSAVYDMLNREIFFTSIVNPERRWIKLKLLIFPLKNAASGKRISIHSQDKGDITRLFQN